ncbi:uncharacterized protein LOC118436975 [Folsomia candida]|uniref:uncharacterized protein LOC118436975 n=1 Tax=Folsomia candida TaxID=158441 RepID=UPI001604C6C1|nr:uncharacterized protein LOC118436975 [Folsomia candida]
MSNVVSLTINPVHEYSIPHFFGEEHFPRLKKLSLHDTFGKSALFTHLNLWKFHRGVNFMSLTLDRTLIKPDFAERIAFHLFPHVKKFDLSILLISNGIEFARLANRAIAPFHLWKLEEGNLVINFIRKSASLVAVLKNVSSWKGVKTIVFEATHVTQEDFSGHVQDIILYSGGFKSVKISGSVKGKLLKRFQSEFEANGGPIKLTGGVHRKPYM